MCFEPVTTLREIKNAASPIRVLADYIERNPNALWVEKDESFQEPRCTSSAGLRPGEAVAEDGEHGMEQPNGLGTPVQ